MKKRLEVDRCLGCRRPLKGKSSIARGYGPTCLARYGRELERLKLWNDAVRSTIARKGKR